MARTDRTAEAAESTPGEDVLARLSRSAPEAPGRLGRYDVTGLLGRGGMGTVYDAVDRDRGTRVALKTLSAADASLTVQLKREFRVVADLAHPNLAPVYELCCEEGLWFFVMERVDGAHFTAWARGPNEADVQTVTVSNAAALLSSGVTEVDPGVWQTQDLAVSSEPCPDPGPASAPVRPIPALRKALAELVRGVTALHDAGLWHGDIKPANVLVRADGRVVVVDFGLARPVGEARARAGPTPGTPMYMAPEQLAGDATGPASDWYAVGTMLYETLTGRLPFRVGTMLELYFRKSHETPSSPRDLVPEIPEDLSEITMALLRPDPERRPRGAELLRLFTGDDAAGSALSERALRSVFVGRQRELSSLEHAYQLARAGLCTVAHVRGPSGIGKSAMVRSFLRGVRQVDQAYVLRGRCYERESVPYKAFDGIIDDLADLLLSLRSHQVEAVLPEWIGELGRAFPALRAVPAVAARAEKSTVAEEAMELRRRAWTALAELLAGLGTWRPIVLSIDDLQWADADSALLLDALLRGKARARLLVIASYRPDDATANAALAGHFERCRELAAAGRLTDVPLAGLPLPEAEHLARTTLQQLNVSASEARVRYLAEEAGGVPFFIEELARFVAARDPSVDREVSLERAITARVRALPAEQRALIEMVAVADTPVPQSLVFEAAGLDAGALPALLALRSASMLSWSGAGADDPVSTYHDRIRESVLAALDPEDRRRRHLALGRVLCARRAGQAPGPWVFEVVRHLGAATALLTDPEERRRAARLHHEAGRLARRAAAFPLAFRCFEGGIVLLADDAWETDYDLALGLHGGAAETAYLSAEWASLEARVAAVKAHAKSVMDQLVAWEVAIDARVGRHEYLEAVDVASEVLALLGVELPKDPDAAAVGAAFQRALACLERVGPAGLEALPDVHDPRAAAAMRIQIRLSPAAYFGRPALLPILAANLISASVDRGLSPATPYALALFGIVLNTMGMYPVSHAWGQLAVKLLDRWDDKRLEAATRHVVFNLVCTWMVPLHTILGPLREVFDIGRRTGDFEYASYAAHGYVHHAIYAARPLGPLLAEALDLGEQMRALGQVNAVHVHEPFEQILKALTGKLAAPSRLDDAGFAEEARMAQAAAEGSRSGIYVIRFAMGLVRYWFGEPAEASACFEIARQYVDASPSVWHVPMMHQLAALAACATWGATAERDRPALRAKIDESFAALRVLAGHAPVNFAHRVSLVEGEILRVEGDRRAALARFEQAISQAREAAWLNDIALAHELAAACHHDEAAARASLTAARDAYAAWGATAKAAALTARLVETPRAGADS